MARTIKEIQDSIIDSLQQESGLSLSTSKVAEWRLWTYVFAVVVHTFEIILDMFRIEVDTLVEGDTGNGTMVCRDVLPVSERA